MVTINDAVLYFRCDSVNDRDGDLDRYRSDVGDTVPAEPSRVGRHCRPHLLHHPQGNPMSNEGNPLSYEDNPLISWWTQPCTLCRSRAFIVHLHLWLVKRLRLRWFGWSPLFYWRTSGGGGRGTRTHSKMRLYSRQKKITVVHVIVADPGGGRVYGGGGG